MSVVSKLRPLLQFNLKTLLMLTALCAPALGWRQDREKLNNLRDAVQGLRAASAPRGTIPGLGPAWSFTTSSTPIDPRIGTIDEFVAAIRQPPGGPSASDEILNLQIGRVHADECVPRIVELLADENEKIRRRAVQALGSIARRSHIAVPALTRALYDESPEVSAEAAHALSLFGERAMPATATLMDVVESNAAPKCAAAAYALLIIDPNADVDRPLAAMLRHDDRHVRYIAAATYTHEALTIDRIQPAVPKLIELLSDDSPKVRLAAARALNRVPATANIVDGLAKALRNETDPIVRQRVSSLLFTGNYGRYEDWIIESRRDWAKSP